MWGFGRDNPCKDLALAEVVAIDFERCFVLNKMGAKKMVFFVFYVGLVGVQKGTALLLARHCGPVESGIDWQSKTGQSVIGFVKLHDDGTSPGIP